MQAPSDSAGSPLAPALQTWTEQLHAARLESRRVRIVGAGSKAFLDPPHDPALIELRTSAHRGIVAYEPSELVVTARAGTPLAEIEALLAEQGQYLAFEPPHCGAGATLGGAVAAGLSGPARASVGALRDFVLGVHVLNGRGQYLEFGGQVMKNVAGYDLSRLYAGSLGSLGVLAQVSLKVLPLPPAEATLRFELPQAPALQQLARWRALPLPLNASCWVRDSTVAGAPEHLYVRLRGAAAAVAAACPQMLAEAPGERLDTATCAPDWQACREQTLPFFTQPPATAAADTTALALWRLSVAPTSAALDAPWPTLIEWHGGLRWVWAPLNQAVPLRAWAQAHGGHASLWRGPPGSGSAGLGPDSGAAALAALRFTPPAPALQAIHQRLKAEFDPHGLFNPGQWGWGL
ncbi:glycolate oxidase subunit GlcE [Serpentinimonas raichei]|uniref:glycolate oxidase subunit GlcE n=1 Tax=Serpentinimonas raichei TaxID=1458425 RepID=UPI0005F0727E|nr:glycolate oxidase subunit GlcE [Serpentinimonas raichei]